MDITAPSTEIILGLAFLLIIANGLSFVAFAVDKRRATSGEQRIPEAFLLKLALFGGWLGAKLGQWLFRHKTRKQPFGRYLNLIGACQMVGLIGAIGMAQVPTDLSQFEDRIMSAIGAVTDDGATDANKMPRRFGPGSTTEWAHHGPTP